MTTPFDMTDEALDAALRDGRDEARLRAHFGDALYEELAHLAKLAESAQARAARAPGQVFLLPGIMGSRLSVREGADCDLIWLNPFALRQGRVTDLQMQSPGVEPSGIFHFAYTRMRLRLRLRGHNVRHLPYDWRQSPHTAAHTLWPEIARAEGPVSLICHSMGGLVARALAARDADRLIRHIVTLGTPNHGSYTPVEVLRGINRNVHLIARVDPDLGPKAVVERVLRHYTGLLEMLPSEARRGQEAWFDAPSWPDGSLLPDPEVLRAAGEAQARLAPPDDRFTQIVGVGRKTLTGARHVAGGLVFEASTDGDGTVPRALAEMDGCRQRFYVEGKHGGLFNQRALINACDDILRGRRPDLPTAPEGVRGTDDITEIPEADLRSAARSGLPRSGDPATHPIPEDEMLTGLISAEADIDTAEHKLMATTPPPSPETREDATYVYTRQRSALRRINVDVMNEDILDVPADAYVLGVFEGVTTLSGAAGAVDRELDGMLSALLADGQITGRKGEVSFIPVPRHHLRTSHLVIVGLGAFGTAETITAAVHVAGRNLMRSLCISSVSNFAGVLLGAGSGPVATDIFRALFAGIFEALEDWDEDHSFSTIRICEYDPNRFAHIMDSLNRTFAGFNMSDCEIVVQEKRLPKRPKRAAATAGPPLPDIFTVRAEIAHEDTADPEVRLLLHHVKGSGRTEAAAMVNETAFPLSALTRRMAPLSGPLASADLPAVAQSIEELIFAPDFYAALNFDHDSGYGLQVICDAWASRIPWEVLHLGGPPIALNGGVSRWYLPASSGVRRSARRAFGSARHSGGRGRDLNMLLVSDPTRDLPGAAREARRIAETVGGRPGYHLELLQGTDATLPRVESFLGRSESTAMFDIFHYAGHAFFEEADRARSGLILNGVDPETGALRGEATLRGTDIAEMAQVPGFVFLNACESVRVRNRDSAAEAIPTPQDYAARNTGLAEAFLLAGVRHIVGTFFPVPDGTAMDFAASFYDHVSQHQIGAALTRARQRIDAEGSADWVNYIHYGAANDRV